MLASEGLSRMHAGEPFESRLAQPKARLLLRGKEGRGAPSSSPQEQVSELLEREERCSSGQALHSRSAQEAPFLCKVESLPGDAQVTSTLAVLQLRRQQQGLAQSKSSQGKRRGAPVAAFDLLRALPCSLPAQSSWRREPRSPDSVGLRSALLPDQQCNIQTDREAMSQCGQGLGQREVEAPSKFWAAKRDKRQPVPEAP